MENIRIKPLSTTHCCRCGAEGTGATMLVGGGWGSYDIESHHEHKIVHRLILCPACNRFFKSTFFSKAKILTKEYEEVGEGE
jgi:hypothetical protein